MLRYAEGRAKAEGLAGIEFCHGGFLSFAATPAMFDAAVSVGRCCIIYPDLWKAVALGNIRRALKPGGHFLLCDVVFASKDRDPRPQFDAFINAMPPSMRGGALGHIAREYSTLDWIMEGLLTRAGFAIQRIAGAQAPLIQYLLQARSLLGEEITGITYRDGRFPSPDFPAKQSCRC